MPLRDLEYYIQEWGINEKSKTPHGVMETAKTILGLEEKHSYKSNVKKFDEYLNDIIEFVNEDVDKKDVNKMTQVNRLLQVIYYTKQLYANSFFIKEAMENEDDYKYVEDTSLFKFMPRDDTLNNKYQNFLLWCMEYLQNNKYRKMGEDVYEEIISNGYNTGSWRKVDTIANVLYGSINKETNYEQFLNITSSTRDIVKCAASFLTNFKDDQFKLIKKDRKVFSFKNGIYFAEEDKFVKYPIDTMGFTSAKYFDIDFEDDALETPGLEQILDYQQFPEDIKKWIYVFIGRLIYEIDEKDGWQCLMFLEGQAGTGKSTIVNVCKDIYDDTDVGVMSNNIQKQFGLSDLYDKTIFIAPEIKKDFSIDQCEFQSVISGDKINVAVKYQQSKSINWKIPGIMAGNEIPDFVDNSGSIQRRIITVKFNYKIKEPNLNLQKELRKEMGNILVKSNRAYLEYSSMHGRTNIWDVLPEYFKETQKEMAAATNPLVHLFCSNKMVFDKKKYIPENVLKSIYNAHCVENNYKKQRWNPDLYIGPIQQFNIKIDKGKKPYNGKMILDTFFIGVDFAEFEDVEDEA